MTPLWAIFTFLNLWWIAAFIVIAVQGQRTDRLIHTAWYASLLSGLITAVASVIVASLQL